MAGGGGVEPLLPMGDGGEVEEFEEAVEVAAAGLGGFSGDDGEVGAELAGEPVHFGAVVGGFGGDGDVCAVREERAEAAVHAVGAAGDVSGWEEAGVGLVEPCGEADAAGDTVDFGEAEAVVGEEEIRTDDGWELLAEGGETRCVEELGRFTGVGKGGDPWGETAGAAAEVETVAGGQEALEPMAEFLELVG